MKKNNMRFGLLFRKKRFEELQEKQVQATAAHKKNIKSIVQSRKSAVNLKQALEQNQITIKIAGAMGHR